EKAIAELETLVERVEEKDAPLDRIEKDIKRAMQLIAFCKTQLRGYKERFSALMDDSNEDSAEG
ncbi:MAG: exodeoxyribonuclease VII small subunit, partial [Bacteroidales bacterium]|nr:exodeoxyribonuclease VII small subunit [Bacteroidales bacterium]